MYLRLHKNTSVVWLTSFYYANGGLQDKRKPGIQRFKHFITNLSYDAKSGRDKS